MYFHWYIFSRRSDCFIDWISYEWMYFRKKFIACNCIPRKSFALVWQHYCSILKIYSCHIQKDYRTVAVCFEYSKISRCLAVHPNIFVWTRTLKRDFLLWSIVIGAFSATKYAVTCLLNSSLSLNGSSVGDRLGTLFLSVFKRISSFSACESFIWSERLLNKLYASYCTHSYNHVKTFYNKKEKPTIAGGNFPKLAMNCLFLPSDQRTAN